MNETKAKNNLSKKWFSNPMWFETPADFTTNCDTCTRELQEGDTTWECWLGNPDKNTMEQTPTTTTCDDKRCREEGNHKAELRLSRTKG